MEQTKSNKGIIIAVSIVCILLVVVCVLMITGVITFSPKEKPVEITEDNEESNEEEYSPWMSYILSQNITKIKLKSVTFVDDANDEVKEIELSTDKLKAVFKKMLKYNLEKLYSVGESLSGYGDILTISYSANGNNYDVIINNDHISCGYVVKDETDSLKYDANFLNALENTSHTVENENVKNEMGAYYFFILKNYDDLMYSEFYN